jgi:hypothetical protein
MEHQSGVPADVAGEGAGDAMIDLSYAPAPSGSVRRVVRLLAHFTVLYGVAMLLDGGFVAARMLGFAGFGAGATRILYAFGSFRGALYLSLAMADTVALVLIILAAAKLIAGAKSRGMLAMACWMHVAAAAALLAFNAISFVLSEGVRNAYVTFSLGSNVAELISRVVMPLMLATVFGGEKGKELVGEA